MDLENFLKEHEREWWTPHQIGKKLGVDIRTVKKVIRRLDKMTHNGWKLVIAERGDRLFCVRMKRDIENSGNLVEAEVSELDGKLIRVPTPSPKQKTLGYFPSVQPPE